jgi:hypothetical protein
MSRKKRMQNLREAKDRRTKKIAIVGAVVLVAVLAFEVPKMMHSGSSSATPAATTTTGAYTTPTSTTPTAAPTTAPGTAAAAGAPTTASMKLPNSDALPQPSKGTLYSFSHFTGKNPFAQQVSDAAPDGTPGTKSNPIPASGKCGTACARQLCKNGQLPASRCAFPGTPQNPAGETRALTANGAARISVNGQVQVVRVGATFPSANPLFRLVSLAHGSVRIGIASGSYSSGAHTVALTPGRTLTLVDSADGVRYKIRLIVAS